jgi:glycosyltransferase involved in cell wall biosynthesis
LSVATGGVTRYTAELSRALAENYPEDEFWLVSDQRYEHPAPEIPNLKCAPGPKNVLERRWWLWGLQGVFSRLGIDVFHGTDFSVPYLPLRPSVMTLHDLSPWLDPRWHADADRVRRRTPVLIRLGRATMILTPSEAIRKAAMERFRIAATRIVAVPHGANRGFRPVGEPGFRKPYFVYIGTLEPRKNLKVLLEAWREVYRECGVELVLAGRARSDFETFPEEPGLVMLGQVEECRLPRLYSEALACVYPSLYEGFGLPVLEAMQCGAVVITSRDPAIGEVSGDAALRLDASDVRAWAEALRHAATDGAWREAMRRKAVARAAGFSWDETARLTREVYAEAVRRFRRL